MHPSAELKLPENIKQQMNSEIDSLLTAGVVEKTTPEPGEFISPIFPRTKKDGSLRVIINLKKLNPFVTYAHFKMDNKNMAARLMTQNCYMASVDLRQAYYMIPMAAEHRKFLKFHWNNELLQFTALPNGLACAPRQFTKLMKPVFAKLRQEGHNCLGYIDDSFIVGLDKFSCESAVQRMVQIIQELGFIIHPVKSVLSPVQRLTFLGFIFDSVNMTVELTPDKKEIIKKACTVILNLTKPSIQVVSELLGLMVAYNEGVELGPLHYRDLERDKIRGLKLSRGNYNAHMQISSGGVLDIEWWLNNVDTATKAVWRDVPSIVVTTDASKKGWGAVMMGQEAAGQWSLDESEQQHINVLELKAGLFGLKSLCKNMKDTAIMLRMDNSTAVAYVNKMGGSKSEACDFVAKEIWSWGIEINIWLTASHIPGINNSIADGLSRGESTNKEWSLDENTFKKLSNLWDSLDIDLFASRLNHKLPVYASWSPDPDAAFIDAFSINWAQFYFYAFPPFSLVDRCLQKIVLERATGVLIVPLWPTRPWWAQLHQLLVDQPRRIPAAAKKLRQPTTGQNHPVGSLQLLACKLSGKPCSGRNYPKEPLIL